LGFLGKISRGKREIGSREMLNNLKMGEFENLKIGLTIHSITNNFKIEGFEDLKIGEFENLKI
jgi:hypothetical protein